MRSGKSQTITLWRVILCLLVVTGLGAAGLDADMLWLDEVFSIGNIGGPDGTPYTPAQVWDSLQANSPQHVPGYFWLLSGWSALVGWSPFALRALSLFFTVMTVAWTYRLGADWLSPRVGLYAALMMSVGAYFIYFAHELRMYSMLPFLSAFVLWIYSRIIRLGLKPLWWEWALFVLGALALMYTHLFGILPLAAISLYHLLFVRKNRRWLVVPVILTLVVTSLLPWLSVLQRGVRNIGLGEEPMPLSDIFGSLLTLFSNGGVLLLLILAALALIPLVKHQRGAREAWFFLVIIFILTLLANDFRPMISVGRTRYLIHLWPLMALMVGLGLSILVRYRYVVPLLLVVWLAFGATSLLNADFLSDMDGPRYTQDYPPLREIVHEVNRIAEPGDFLIGFSRHPHVFNIFRFFTIGDFHLRDLNIDRYFVTIPDAPPPADLTTAAGTRLTVWFTTEPQTPADEIASYRAALEDHYVQCETLVETPILRIERYAYSAFGCLDQADTGESLITYDTGIRLADIRITTENDIALIAAAWAVDESVPTNTYSVSLKLWPDLDVPPESFVDQADYGLRGAGFGWQLATIPLATLPSGEYSLTATVYNWATGERLRGVSDNHESEELPVGVLQIP